MPLLGSGVPPSSARAQPRPLRADDAEDALI